MKMLNNKSRTKINNKMKRFYMIKLKIYFKIKEINFIIFFLIYQFMLKMNYNH